MMMLWIMKVLNKSGGCLTAKRTIKPVLTVYGQDESIGDIFLSGVSNRIQSCNNDKECPINDNFVPMQSENMKLTSEEHTNENLSERAKGSQLSETCESIQESME
jgi:hypothetical protein